MGKHDELAKIFSPKNQLHCQCFNTLGKRKNTMSAPLYLLILLHIVFMTYFGRITEQKVSETFKKKGPLADSSSVLKCSNIPVSKTSLQIPVL